MILLKLILWYVLLSYVVGFFLFRKVQGLGGILWVASPITVLWLAYAVTRDKLLR